VNLKIFIFLKRLLS